MSVKPRDEQGRFVETERARLNRIAREHGALLAGLFGDPHRGADSAAEDAMAIRSPHPPGLGMEGGWRGEDIGAHRRRREDDRETFLDDFFTTQLGRHRTAGRHFKPYALDDERA